MAVTQFDYPRQVVNYPEIDPRSPPYNCVGNGVANDTAGLQAALDAAGVIGTVSSPCVVLLGRGRWGTSTVLKFRRDGIILQGYGMQGEGNSDNNSTTIVALSSHDATPMIQIDPNDAIGGGFQWYRGTCLRDISIDVTGSSNFTTGSTPPSVVKIRGLSNCPNFQNVSVIGATGVVYDIAMSISTAAPNGAISENLTFLNTYAYSGFLASGSNNQVPKGPAILVAGADNILFEGGLLAYNYSPGVLPVNNNLTDVAGVQVIPAAFPGGGVNTINNGFTIRNMAITNYVVHYRFSSLDNAGTVYSPQYCRVQSCVSENYNKVFQFCLESTANVPGFWRGQYYVSECEFGGANAGYGTNPYIMFGSKMQGGHLQFAFANSGSDINLDTTTNGVFLEVGPNPNGAGSFFDVNDSGTNNVNYTKSGLAGRILNGVTRCVGSSTAASATTSAPGGQDVPLMCWGIGIKIENTAIDLGATGSSTIGQFGTLMAYRQVSTGNWYLAFCVQSGNTVPNALWYRVQLSPW